MAEQKRVYVGIGSNIDREKNITGGLAELASIFGELQVSSIYESRAYGFSGDNFYNLVAGFTTDLPVDNIAGHLREIEYRFGRERQQEKYAPRTLDIDLLVYGDHVHENEHLALPREDIEKYSFVLCPLAEIAPGETHPLTGKTYAQMWEEFEGDRDNLWKAEFRPGSGKPET